MKLEFVFDPISELSDRLCKALFDGEEFRYERDTAWHNGVLWLLNSDRSIPIMEHWECATPGVTVGPIAR